MDLIYLNYLIMFPNEIALRDHSIQESTFKR